VFPAVTIDIPSYLNDVAAETCPGNQSYRTKETGLTSMGCGDSEAMMFVEVCERLDSGKLWFPAF